MSKKIAIAYIPVIHKGYLDFIESLLKEGIHELYLIGDLLLVKHEELDYINRKDRIRAVSVPVIADALSAICNVSIAELTENTIENIQKNEFVIYAPKEDITVFVIGTYFAGHPVEYKNVFLRFNRENTGEMDHPATPAVGASEFEASIFGKVLLEAEKSADWWRQIGAAVVKDSEVISIAHNEHMPDEQIPNIFGDARSLYKKGININYATSAHAEVGAIGEIARKGVSTQGCELFVTDFPCPYCARLIAKAGIKKVYYLKGYAVLDGDTFLREEGVELVQIKLA